MNIGGIDINGGTLVVPELYKDNINRQQAKPNLKPNPSPSPLVQLNSLASKQAGEAELIEAIEKANKVLVGPNMMLKYSIHEGTKQIIVKVLNEETGELIREIPSEKLLDMFAKMWELAGLVVDEKV